MKKEYTPPPLLVMQVAGLLSRANPSEPFRRADGIENRSACGLHVSTSERRDDAQLHC
jgi:hypothetical protein